MENRDRSREEFRKAGKELKNATKQVAEGEFRESWESIKDSAVHTGEATGLTEDSDNR